MTPRRFTRSDGVICEVMQWNPLSTPQVISWLLDHDTINHVSYDEDTDTHVLTITQPGGRVVVREDELVVRIRRASGTVWEKCSPDEYLADYTPL